MAHELQSDTATTFTAADSGWFWNHHFWLPPGVKWADLRSKDEWHAKLEDLCYYPILLAIGLIFLRFTLERLVFQPLGKHYGMQHSREDKIGQEKRLTEGNEVLESAFQNIRFGWKKIDNREFSDLAKRTDLKIRQVERWFRRRASLDKPTKLDKFCESGWRCFCYISAIIVGLAVLWDKPWLTDIKHVWYGYPRDHILTPGLWWYYMMSLALYYSFMFSQFSDIHRKDFWQMFIHHLATIFLIGLSWTINMFRFGTLVLLVHDLADPFLEAAKMAKYTCKSRLCWFCFGGFVVMFVVTRLYIYPFHILRTMFFDAEPYFPKFPALYFFYIMLTLLLVLHLFWSYLVFKVIYRAAFRNELRDSRSSESSSSCSSGTGTATGEEKDDAGGVQIFH